MENAYMFVQIIIIETLLLDIVSHVFSLVINAHLKQFVLIVL